MKQVNVGIIGFGTVGAGTAEILLKNREIIKKRVGLDIILKRVADLDLDSDRGITLPQGVLSNDAAGLLNDPEIDIVVELIGGLTTAKQFISTALKNGKHVVTANKALLAEFGSELYGIASQKGVNLAYEAAVGGGMPVIVALREGLAANNTTTIMGILNGTSNYILTRMSKDGLPYEEAVEGAIKLGYAEDPPTLDVDGTDAAHKLAILISLAYGAPAPFESIYKEGIDKLTQEDIQFADEFGYCIKLLTVARDLGGEVEARVHPAMLPKGHILSNVNEAFNAVFIEGDYVGPTLYYGQGAGRRPTGSAVVSDIMSIARKIKAGSDMQVCPLGFADPSGQKITIQSMKNLKTAYYFRFSALDKPGVLSKIAGILGEKNISISSVIQKGREIEGVVPIVMLTHEAIEKDVTEALEKIDRLDVLQDKTMMIRVMG
ncbi:MAG: homoserine dehydrogenase [Deltaproteobacteria bacterium]|nr:homoserine dehydrogenase [Deltaproteobacteria bacterium]